MAQLSLAVVDLPPCRVLVYAPRPSQRRATSCICDRVSVVAFAGFLAATLDAHFALLTAAHPVGAFLLLVCVSVHASALVPHA